MIDKKLEKPPIWVVAHAARLMFGFACVLGLSGCGQSERSSATGEPHAGTGGALGGGAGTPGGTENGGAGGSAGRGAGGAASGGMAGGGEAGSGMAGSGGSGGTPIDPDVTRRYTWQECGRIPSRPERPNYAISSLDMDASGALLVTNDGRATAWRVAEPFEASEPLWSDGGEGAYNTDVSEDGTMVAVSGDLRLVFDALDGSRLPLPGGRIPELVDDDVCIFTEYRFSRDGRFIAGKNYRTVLEVFETVGFTQVAELETSGCGQGLMWSEERLVTPEVEFLVENWSSVSTPRPSDQTTGLPPPCLHYLDPDFAQPTVCCSEICNTAIGDGTTLPGGRHPRFTPDRHWMVSGGTLVHVPSREIRSYDANATEGLFTPEGDVIAGEGNGAIVKFCRSE